MANSPNFIKMPHICLRAWLIVLKTGKSSIVRDAIAKLDVCLVPFLFHLFFECCIFDQTEIIFSQFLWL